MKKSSPNWFFTKKSWLFGWRQPVKKVTRKAPEREKSGKSWFSESPSSSECSDRSHNLRAASGHGYYRLRAFQHHPSSFTLKNLGFGVLGGMVRTKCRQQRRGAKILDFKVLELVGPSKLIQSASYCTRMLYPRVLSIANVSEWLDEFYYEKNWFLGLGGMVRTKCGQQRLEAKILDFEVLELIGPSKLIQSAS